MESTECGAASLAMMLEYYGRYVTLEELRGDCGVSRNGVSAKNIALAAMHHGLDVTPMRLETDEIREVKLPAIIHWNMNHFVVLCGFKKRSAVIADPESGLREVSESEFSRSFTGVTLLMEPSESFKKTNRSRREASYLYTCVKQFIPAVAAFLVTELCMIVGNTAMLFLDSKFIDSVIINNNTKSLYYLLTTLFVSGSICIAAIVLRETLMWRLGRFISTKINTDFIIKLLRLPIEFFMNRSAGDLTGRQNANLEMGDAIAASLFPMPAYLMQILLYLVLMVSVNVPLAVIAAVFGILNIILMIIVSRLAEQTTPVYSRDIGKLHSEVSRSVDMIETIKSFGAENMMYSRLLARGTAMLNSRTKYDRLSIFSGAWFNLINLLSSGFILIVGASQIISGSLSTGMLISMNAVAAAMLLPVDNVIRAGIMSHSIRGDMARTDDVMRYRNDDRFLPGKEQQTGEIQGDIEIKNVSFSYSSVEPPVVRDISISIGRGASVAITGESGCGKSTVAKLIAAILTPTEGEITYSGLGTEEFKRTYFYSKIASVSQNFRLFSGTIIDNITMWDERITYDEAVEAAKAACIHEDILSRPQAYRDRVEENGKNFSGGQRQRLELARALVKKPSVLILDEATSALDADTEAEIMRNIKAMGITLIVIAHRLSTIMDCDEIILMDKGRIAERGTHTALMKNRSIYYDLIRSNN